MYTPGDTNMVNFLITSVSGKVDLVNRFRKAVVGTNQIHVCDIDPESVAFDFADKYFVCPRLNNPSALRQFIEYCVVNNIGYIVPTRDEDCEYFSRHQNSFAKYNINILSPFYECVAQCTDKSRFAEVCSEFEWKHPEILSPPTFGKSIIKPVNSSGSKSVRVVEHAETLKNEHVAIDEILQRFIEGHEYTVDCFKLPNHEEIHVTVRQRNKIVDGEAVHSTIVVNDKIANFAKTIVMALQLNYHTNIQFIQNNIDTYVLEVNPRFGGSSCLSLEGGYDSIEALMAFVEHRIYVPAKPQIGLQVKKFVKPYYNNKEVVGQTFCIDIDGTLCTEGVPYELAEPIQKVIDKINKLYHAGNKIILQTARGYTSKTDWSELTASQLQRWGVKYHDLCFTKPYADYYIDNKGISVYEWI